MFTNASICRNTVYQRDNIAIVSDDVAKDGGRQKALKLAAPSGLRVAFFSSD